MSYSCTAKANKTLKHVEDYCREENHSSNVFFGDDGNEYFYEVGRENSDGSITGAVNLLKDQLAYRKGSFRIDSDGTLVRFPHLPKVLRKHIKAEVRAQKEFDKGALFVVAE